MADDTRPVPGGSAPGTTCIPPDLPAPLRGADVGTFAHHTVVERLPDTVRRILTENDLPPDARARMTALLESLPHGSVCALADEGPDIAAWAPYIDLHAGASWLEVPWFFCETYFHRRVMAAAGYFTGGTDPYRHQKVAGLEVSRADGRRLVARVDAWRAGGWQAEALGALLHLDLWGNQADLNMWAAGDADRPNHADNPDAHAHLLADDTAAVVAHLERRRTAGPLRIDVIVDNAGFELVSDLTLVDYLLGTAVARTVRLHVKLHPTFVSDATVADVRTCIDLLACDEADHVQALAGRLEAYLDEGRLTLHDDRFWTSPLEGWHLPTHLRAELTAADLVISKGDANYRRLVGDRHWPFTVPAGEVLGYFPAPLVLLRTLKSEVAVGLPEGTEARLDAEDPAWRVNGRWGVIQFVQPG